MRPSYLRGQSRNRLLREEFPVLFGKVTLPVPKVNFCSEAADGSFEGCSDNA
jgi:hypothetical protein